MSKFMLMGAGRMKRGGTVIWPLFWTIVLEDGQTLGLKIETTDTKPCTIDWGDGTKEALVHNTMTDHTYASAGTYPIRIQTPAKVDTITTDDDNLDRNGDVVNTDLVNMTELYIKRSNISSIQVATNTALEILYCNGNNLSTLDVSANTALTWLYCVDNPSLSVLDIEPNVNLTTLYCGQCNLSAATIDQILIDLDTQGNEDGTLDFSTNTGSSDIYRSAAALTAKNNLLAKGWTITTGVSGTAFWSINSISGDSITLTITTTDGEDVVVDWGDDVFEIIESGVATEHTYDLDAHTLRIYEPARILSILNNDEVVDIHGTVACENFTNMTTLKVRKAAISSVTVASDTKLTTVEVNNNSLPATPINNLLINLDTAGESSGTLNYDGNSGQVWSSLSSNGRAAHNSLVGKSWSILPSAPSAFWNIAPVSPTYLLISDVGNNRIKIHTTEGEFVTEITGFTAVAGVTVDPYMQHVYVIDSGEDHIKDYTLGLVYQGASTIVPLSNYESIYYNNWKVAISCRQSGGYSWFGAFSHNGGPIWVQSVIALAADDYRSCVYDGSNGTIYPVGVAVDGNGGGVQKWAIPYSGLTWSALSRGMGGYTGQFGSTFDNQVSGKILVTCHNRVWSVATSGMGSTRIIGNSDGSAGSGDNELNTPQGICQDADGNIYVADAGTNRIKVYTHAGVFVRAFGSTGSGNDNFNAPGHIAFAASLSV